MKQIKLWKLLSVGALCALVLPAAAADADVEWDNDFEFLVRLGQERFDLYADMQRQIMARKYTSRQDDLKIANAVYFFSIRKTQDAERQLASFKPDHAMYTRVLYIRGTKYAELGQYPQSDKAFKEYFKLIPDCPKGKRGKKEFVMALQYYNSVLKELGRGNEAAALIDKMPPDDNMGERELTYLKQLSKIEAEEGKLDDGKAVDGKVLTDATNELKSLFFVRDGISALAAIQVGRIQGILGNNRLRALKGKPVEIAKIPYFMNAIKAIKQFQDFVAEMEDGNSKSTSPMPELLYYRGIAIRGQAEVTAAKGDLKLAGKQLAKGAVTSFKKIQEEYKKSPFAKKLPKQYLLCEEVNTRWKLGAKLDLPKVDKSDMAAVFEPADIILRDKKDYAEAAKRYKEILDKNTRNSEVVNHVGNYMQCLAMMDRYDEGRKILEQLAKSFPDEKSGLGKAALMLGAYANKRMKEWPKAKPNPYKAKQEELYFWARNMFVDNDPGHPQAAAVAYDLAVTKFNEAIGAMKAAKALPAGGKQDAALKAANEKMKAVIPYYKRVAEVFPLHTKGKAALMKVGQLYNIVDQKDAAMEYFRRFLAADDGSQSLDDILEAQYMLAELNLRIGRPKDAYDNYLKVKAMTAPGAKYSKLKQSALLREVAFAYLPDMVNRESNLLTNQMVMMEERKNKLNNDIYNLDLEVRAADKALKAMPAQETAITEQGEECARVVSSFEFDYKGKAEAQAKAEAAKPNAPKTYQEYYDIFIKGVEDAAHSNATTETEAIAAKSKAVEDEIASLNQARAAITRNTAALDASNAKMQADIKTQKAKIAEIEASFAKIAKDIEDAIAARDKMQETLNTSTDDAEIKKTREALKAQELLVAKLENDKLDIVSNAAKQTIINCQRDIQAKEGAIADNAWHLQLQKAEAVLVEMKLKAAAEQQAVLDARRKFLASVKELLEKDEAARLKANAQIKAEGLKIAELVKDGMKKELALVAQLKTLMAVGSKKCVERKAALQKELAKITEDIKPLEKDWRKQKSDAVAGYREYLKLYPNGKYFAICTTDLAGALVDMEQYSEAVGQLKNLVGGRVPECSDAAGNAKCDPQKTLNALYNLAKAQTKAKNYAEASGTYMRLMDSKNAEVKKAVSQMPLGNLFFIADQGMEVNAPQAALMASDIILNRVSSSKQAAAQLRPAQIEKCCLNAAKAALMAKDAVRAKSYVDKLLKMNPKTAFMYDARFIEAEAYVLQGKINDGIGMLNQMIRKVTDSAVSNRIRCEVARLYLVSGKAEYRDSAVSVYRSIVDFAKESQELNAEWTATPEAKANQQWVDTAFVELAKLYRGMNKSKELDELKGLYRKIYPNGAKIGELSSIN